MHGPSDFQITREVVAELPEGTLRDDLAKMLDSRDAAYAESAVFAADRQFAKALVVYGSEQIADRLVTWDETYHFTDDETRELLTRYWEIAEAWSGDERLRDGMFTLLRRVAPLHLPDGADPLPDGALTVYRGNLGEEPGGGSWTLDPAVAERFATMANSLRGKFLGMYREGGVPTVWRGEVDSADVLGYFGGRGEAEVVVEADAVSSVERIREARPPLDVPAGNL